VQLGRDAHLGASSGTRRTERRPAGCTCPTVMVSAKVGTRAVIDNAYVQVLYYTYT
jgi:hypothetical protein